MTKTEPQLAVQSNADSKDIQRVGIEYAKRRVDLAHFEDFIKSTRESICH